MKLSSMTSFVIFRKIIALCRGGFSYIRVTPKVNGKTRPYNFQNPPLAPSASPSQPDGGT